MEYPTKQQWFMIAAGLTVVAGIVWGRFWRPALLICTFIWVVLVIGAFLSRNAKQA
jgi:hypothetical protein